MNRSVYKKAIENQNFDQLTDFYCWIFSKTANLIDLLVTDKTTSKTNQETKKNDPTFYVSTNWKFMKDLYNILTKMVSFKISNFVINVFIYFFILYSRKKPQNLFGFGIKYINKNSRLLKKFSINRKIR